MENKIYTVIVTGGAYEDRFENLSLATLSEAEARAHVFDPKGKPAEIQWSYIQEWVDGKAVRSVSFETYVADSDEGNRFTVVEFVRDGDNIVTRVPIVEETKCLK